MPEPTSGSVRPKQPIFSKRAIGGSHFCFCSSDPNRAIEPMARPLCTPKKVVNDGSTRDISIRTMPFSFELWSSTLRPPISSFFSGSSSSNGKASSTQ